MDLSTLAAMPVPSPMRPSMICSSRRRRRGQNASRSAGRPRGGRTATGLDLKTRPIVARHRRRGGAKGGAGGASAYLLGADEVVAEAASLFLRKHHDLDGFLGETLRRWTGRGEEGSGRKPRRPRHEAHVRESGFSRPGAPRRGARPRGREPLEPDRGGAAARSVSEPTDARNRRRFRAVSSRNARSSQSRVRRHLAHAPRTSPSRRTSCRRARPLGSDARRSSGRRPSNGRPRGRRRLPRGGSRSWSRWRRARPPPRRRRGTEPCRHCGRSPWGERQWRWQRR